jgi:hypothetical protein
MFILNFNGEAKSTTKQAIVFILTMNLNILAIIALIKYIFY